MSGHESTTGTTQPSGNRKRLIIIFSIAIVALLVLGSVLYVYTSPSHSWNSSTRDHDADGVADASDVFPSDPMEWKDSDSDGVGDNADAFPGDPERTLPEITFAIAASNHNWTLTVESIWADAGKNVDGIALGDIRVEATDSSSGSELVTVLPALFRNASASGVSYVDTMDQASLNEGDAFVLALSEYRPGSSFNLTSTKVGRLYASVVLRAVTPSGTGGQNWTSDSFRWTFSSLTPRVSWNDVEIHISDGISEASWAPDIDEDGNTNLPNADFGSRSLACGLRSGAPNAMIDPGDNFTITPSLGFDSDKTYSVILTYDFGGEIAGCTFRLSASSEQVPTLDLEMVNLLGDLAYVEFTWVNGTLSWDDIVIRLYGDATAIFWLVNASELGTGGVSTTDCGASILDGMTISCGAEDIAGNGLVDDSDVFALAATPGFLDVTVYTITVMYKPTWEPMASLSFTGQPVTPTSALVKQTITYGVKFSFVPMSQDTPWGDVTILLQDDAGNTVVWAPLTTDLDNGTTDRFYGGAKYLGSLMVWCNITDLAGNGYVNQGDFFTFTTGSASTFSASTTYTVTIMHDPTSAEICHASFNG